jgi:hypothetical protein
MNVYSKDSLVRVNVTFALSGTNTDPSVVKAYYKSPTGVVTTLVYGVDNALVKDAVGQYHVDILAQIVGNWFYRFEGTGTLVAANEGEFVIQPSQIL